MLQYLSTNSGIGGYCFDRICINTYYKPSELRKLFPKKLFNEECHSFKIHNASAPARRWKIKSRIDVVAPNLNCLELLSLGLRNDKVHISYIEITQDIFAESKKAASKAAYDLIETTRKKYSATHFIYHSSFEDETKNYQNDPSLFGIMTGYFGSKNFKYVPYPRLSKINGNPCIHAEWRITGASLIAKKTGVRTIHDLMTLNIQMFFGEQKEKFLVREEINGQEFGKWLRGWKRRRVLSRRQYMRIGLMSATFLNVYKIRTYGGLVQKLRELKQEAKKKKGRKNRWAIKLIELKDYGKFATRLH